MTPGIGNNVSWSIEPAFPNLFFRDPLVITHHPRQDLLFVASRDGQIEYFQNDPNVNNKQTLVDLRNETAVVWDGGFLGLAFHPEFGQAGSPNRNYFYVYYTKKNDNGDYGPTDCGQGCFSCFDNPTWWGSYLTLERYSVNEGTLNVNKNSRQTLFKIRQFGGTHRGGGPIFGKDGFLYVAIGDQARYGGAQRIDNNFEGGYIRIDVDQKGGDISHAPRRRMGQDVGNGDETSGNGYYIPNDNPWLDNNGGIFEEFWAIGHRNPHRISVDRVTGDIWSGEIGENDREEVNLVTKGSNGGWPVWEGNLNISGSKCNIGNLGRGFYKAPITDFFRNESNAIIGGNVYRGSKFPLLYGKYLCGGYSQNRIYTVEANGNRQTLTSFSPGGLITWGEDLNGELYMGRQNGNTNLYQLQANGVTPPAPNLLSQTGAFTNLSSLTVRNGIIPYEMIEPFWSDGADKYRWIAIPNDGSYNTANEQVVFSENGNWQFPIGTVVIKHFEYGGKKLETRFEVKGENGQYYYLSYHWNDQGTDAVLGNAAKTETYTINGEPFTWYFPNRLDCESCHTAVAGKVLGVRTKHLNTAINYGPSLGTQNQLLAWSNQGIFTQTIAPNAIDDFITAAAKDDLSASLEDRARSYLDVNCGYCHQPGSGNRAVFDALLTTPFDEQNLIYGFLNNSLSNNDAFTIVPQDIANSMIHFRMNSLTDGVAMPPIAKNKIDKAGVQLIAEWINSLPLTDSPAAVGNGTGLVGNYFQGANSFTNKVTERLDATIDFAYGYGDFPEKRFDVPNLGEENFSVRWTGYIEAPVTGNYTFSTNSDDGVQLKINSETLINNLTYHGNTEDIGQLFLTEGQRIPIELSYFNGAGNYTMLLSWQAANLPKQVIPTQYLYPCAESSQPIVNDNSRCNPGTISLTATPQNGGVIEWYDALTNGNLLQTGTTYTPTLNQTTTFYVQESNNPQIINGGPIDRTITEGGYHENTAYGLEFDALKPIILNSVKVYANVAGNRTFIVQNAEGNTISSSTIFVPTGESRVTLDFEIPSGDDYVFKLSGEFSNLYRNQGALNYPYQISDLVSITGSTAGNSLYYYFYDWAIYAKEAVCNYAQRIPITATVSGDCNMRIQARVLLEGFFNGNDGLVQNANHYQLIPTNQPFNTAPWFYTGNEQANTIPFNAVDWILLVTRDVNGNILEQKAGFINTNGVLIDLDGSQGIPVNNAANYFSIHHKSHLAIMSANPYTSGTYDFTNNVNQAMGRGQMLQQGGKYMMYSGDFDCNGIINNLDYNRWNLNSARLNQYLSIDGDGNGIINNLDYNLWTKNRSKIGHPPLQY